MANEEKELLTSLIQMFKEENPEWTEIKTILTDKDLVVTELIPQAQLQLCEFHVLKTFRTKITCEGMKITSEEKLRVLEVLQDILSANEETYNAKHQALKNLGHSLVTDYYDSNWHPIRYEWVRGLKTSIHLGNTTSNRIESMNQKLKQVIQRCSKFRDFWEDLLIILDSFRKERDFRIYQTIQRRPAKPLAPNCPESMYRELLTPFAFKKVQIQLWQSDHYELPNEEQEEVELETSSGTCKVSAESCSCGFMQMNQLPCRHLLAFRRSKGRSLFYKEACGLRWKLTDYHQNCFVNADAPETEASQKSTYVQRNKENSTLTEMQKFKKCNILWQENNSLLTKVSTKVHKERIGVLRELFRIWREGGEVSCTRIDQDEVRPSLASNFKP